MLESAVLNWTAARAPRPVTLRGRYVTLLPLDANRDSAELWQHTRGHDELWTWMSDGPFGSEADLHRALAEKQHSSSSVFFTIFPEQSENSDLDRNTKSGHASGYASFMRIEPAHGVVEVGNILLTPGLQRTRAATEAMFLMMRRVFEDLGYRRYEWKCNALNEPSRKAALRLGFTFEGIFRQHMVVKDHNRDTAWFAILDHEWPARRLAFEKWLDPTNFDQSGIQLRSLGSF
ncbi:MAG TPA: GNAT family protein [Terracidiphilus sp.]|jgi:RimJ/RimL family protein N-acetyltransferase